MFNANDIHFVSNNSTCQFKVPQEVGPFNVKKREVQAIVKGMLESLNFPINFVWKHDPKGILSNKRRYIRMKTYVHETSS